MFINTRHFLTREVCKYGQQIQKVYIRNVSQTVQDNLSRRQSNHSHFSTTYGQPTAITHPHLIKPGELVPGIQLHEFKKRRCKLMEKIVSQGRVCNTDNQHLVIIPSSSKVYMSDKIPYVFRQNTNFLYYTGCQEPDSILVIATKNKGFTSILFMRKKDEHSELWDGPRTGVDAATEMFDVDITLPVTEFSTYFSSFLKEHKNSMIWYENLEVVQPNLQKLVSESISESAGHKVTSPTRIIHEMRLIKSQCEIELMKKSCEIASAAIAKTIESSKPNISEHQLFATVDYECRMNGAEFLAYPPVVAGGKNANIIHYINNNQIIQNGDMVLMDAGCEYHGYTSDITRTWPINGTFTPEQRILYEIVLDVQDTLIQELKSMPSLDELYENMCTILGKRLQEIGLIPKHFSGDKLMAAAYTYCPHHVSHYLGMDVHDTGKIPRSVKVEPGMIITVEPGIYVSPKNAFAPQQFYGLGIRIEDDILITETEPLNLTQSCPKQIESIETLASRNQ